MKVKLPFIIPSQFQTEDPFKSNDNNNNHAFYDIVDSQVESHEIGFFK